MPIFSTFNVGDRVVRFNVGDRVVRVNCPNTDHVPEGSIGTISNLFGGYITVKWDHLEDNELEGSFNSAHNLELLGTKDEIINPQIQYEIGDHFFDPAEKYWTKITKVWVQYSTTYIGTEVVAMISVSNRDAHFVGESFSDSLREFQACLDRKSWIPVTKESVEEFKKNWELL